MAAPSLLAILKAMRSRFRTCTKRLAHTREVQWMTHGCGPSKHKPVRAQVRAEGNSQRTRWHWFANSWELRRWDSRAFLQQTKEKRRQASARVNSSWICYAKTSHLRRSSPRPQLKTQSRELLRRAVRRTPCCTC